ncbi:hypothetical protein E4U57_001279 [Claviceps arundinis]|uniref:Uncharacterized protein n=1 Tax=Claviceps arundinis TaxID=1623583 RepID=A0ABQ7PB29_9HYPO|nr:hypothetical protein E4U57_001279 [Claviceps arundinis]
MGEKQTNLLDAQKLLKNLRLTNTVISKQEATIKEVYRCKDEEAQKEHPWVVRMIEEMKTADPRFARYPYIEFRGAPHRSPKTNDSYHASVVLRKEFPGRGTGVTLHVFPNGNIQPSRQKYSGFQATAATAEELSKSNATAATATPQEIDKKDVKGGAAEPGKSSDDQ